MEKTEKEALIKPLQIIVIGTLVLFLGIIFGAVFYTKTRNSGSTKLDPKTIKEMRAEKK